MGPEGVYALRDRSKTTQTNKRDHQKKRTKPIIKRQNGRKRTAVESVADTCEHVRRRALVNTNSVTPVSRPILNNLFLKAGIEKCGGNSCAERMIVEVAVKSCLLAKLLEELSQSVLSDGDVEELFFSGAQPQNVIRSVNSAGRHES